jgi:hypothetical protein
LAVLYELVPWCLGPVDISKQPPYLSPYTWTTAKLKILIANNLKPLSSEMLLVSLTAALGVLGLA